MFYGFYSVFFFIKMQKMGMMNNIEFFVSFFFCTNKNIVFTTVFLDQ